MVDDRNTEKMAIIHVSDGPDDVRRALNAAQGLRAALPKTRVGIVINGDALHAVPTMSDLDVPEGVEVAACAIGLHRRSISEAEIPAGVDIVPAVPVAIIEAQLNGAAYLRL